MSPGPAPSSVARRARTALVLSLLAAFAALTVQPIAASPARAADADDAPLGVPGRGRVALFAAALREDPVFVSPSLSRIATPGELTALRREVEAMPVPTYVVIAPNLFGERDGESGDRPALLHDRLGRDGVYLTSTEYGSISASAFGARVRVSPGTAATDASIVVPRKSGPFARVRQALREMRTGDRPAAALAAERRFERQSDGRSDDDDGGGVPRGIVLVLAFAAGLAVPIVVLLVPRARRRRRAALEQAAPRLVPVDPSSARTTALRSLSDLARALASTGTEVPAAQRRYDAASKLLDDHADEPVALVAADVLARGGRALLGRPPGAGWRPCFFDPRHGEGTQETRFRRGAVDVPLPACASCAKAIADRRSPEALADGDAPYWERDTGWARTGIGALDDDLADLVLRGDVP